MQALEHNITRLNLRIANACNAADRANNSVKLLAVTKTREITTLTQAYHLGLRAFGENYPQEAQTKIAHLPNDIEWHFIGPIQSNKTRFIAEHFSWVHSIDRLKIAQRLHEQRPSNLPPLNCLIQINISQEPQKSGIAAEELFALATALLALPHLRLCGLMAIPKAEQSEAALTNDFANMALLLRQLQTIIPSANTLSMGMSADLELAIQYGATIVRVGTDLFGPRT
jgi:pyridoxal phosphate enzyme (YggS family)